MPFFKTLSREEVTEFPAAAAAAATAGFEPGTPGWPYPNNDPGEGYKLPPMAGLVGNIKLPGPPRDPKGLEAGLEGGDDPPGGDTGE